MVPRPGLPLSDKEQPSTAAAFNTSASRPTGNLEPSRAPAPGWYDVDVSPESFGRYLSLGDSCFRSKVNRLAGVGAVGEDVPGPGSYEQPLSRPPTRPGSRQSVAAFGTSAQRLIRRELVEKAPAEEPEQLALAICAKGFEAGAFTAREKRPPLQQRPASRQRMRGMQQRQITDDSIQPEQELYMWIGGDAAPTKREKIMAKADLPMSAFASGTQRNLTKGKETDSGDEGSPGPGQYKDPGFTEQLKLRLARRRGIPQGHFGGVRGKSGFRKTFVAQTETSDPYLGPGWYEPTADTWTPRPASANSPFPSFGTREKRDLASADGGDTPGPGDHDHQNFWNAKPDEHIAMQSSALSPVRYGPEYSPKPEAALAREAAAAALEQGRLDASTRKALRLAHTGPPPEYESPGPGEYGHHVPPRTERLLRNQPEDEAFLATEPRFNPPRKTYRMETPGPGRYSPETVSTSPVIHDFGNLTGRKIEQPANQVAKGQEPPRDFQLRGTRAG